MATPEQSPVTTIDKYVQAFEDSESVRVEQLCGRLLRGKRDPEDFATLSDDPSRRIVMLMGPDGLEMLPGRSGYDMLRVIGYTQQHIKNKVEEGNVFKLAVFPVSEIARLATWDAMTDLTSEAYPDVSEALEEHREALKTTPFTDIEAAAGFTFGDIKDSDKHDERYMTYERFRASGQDLADTRAFYYYTVHLREQYGGEGRTIDYNGKPGMLEYAILNRPVAELGRSAMLDVSVVLPAES